MSILINGAILRPRLSSGHVKAHDRVGIRIHAANKVVDLREPLATKLEDAIADAPTFYRNTFERSRMAPELATFSTLDIPFRYVSGVVILPSDFHILGDLVPDNGPVRPDAQ